MKVSGERIIIFGDSLSHPGADDGPTQSMVTLGSSRFSSAPGDLMGSMLLEQGAAAVLLDARVGRSATNYWRREDTSSLMATVAEFRPTLAVVMLGTNDLGMNREVEKTSFEAIRDTLKAAGAREVWAIGPMTYRAPNDAYNAKAGAIFDLMKSVFGGGYTLDARPLTASAARSRDGVHFTTTGAREAAAALTKALLAKNPKAAAMIGWVAGGLGVLAAILIGYKLAKRGGGSLGDGGRLALPPAPDASDEDLILIARDAYALGNEEEADRILEDLSAKGRQKLAKIHSQWAVAGDLKAFDPHDLLADEIRDGASEEEAVAIVREELDEYRKGWIREHGDDVREEGGIPELAWERYYTDALAMTETHAQALIEERNDRDREKAIEDQRAAESELDEEIDRQNDAGLDGDKNPNDLTADEMLPMEFKKLVADDGDPDMNAAQDLLLEKGKTITDMYDRGYTPNRGRFVFREQVAADDPLFAVDWSFDEKYDGAWSDFTRQAYIDVFFGGPNTFDGRIHILRKPKYGGGNEYARKSVISDAWAVTRALKRLPTTATKEEVEAAVDKALDQDNSEPSELWGKREPLAAPGAPKRSFAKIRDLFQDLMQEDPPQFVIAEDLLRQEGVNLRKIMGGEWEGERILHYYLETKRVVDDLDWRTKEKKVGGGIGLAAGARGYDDHSRASWLNFFVIHGSSRYGWSKKLDEPMLADDARKMVVATIWELSKRIAPFSLDTDEATIRKIAEKTVKQRHNIVKRYDDIA